MNCCEVRIGLALSLATLWVRCGGWVGRRGVLPPVAALSSVRMVESWQNKLSLGLLASSAVMVGKADNLVCVCIELQGAV